MKNQTINQTENKLRFSRILGDYNNLDFKRYWYYREKVINQHGADHLKGYYCYQCKSELVFKYHQYSQPYRNHGREIKRVVIKQEKDWNTKKKKVIYYNALCCKCYENCDCLEYLAQEIKELTEEQKELNIFSIKLKVSRLLIEKFQKMLDNEHCESDESYWTTYYLKRHLAIERENENRLLTDYEKVSKEKELTRLQELFEKVKYQKQKIKENV